MRVCFTSFSASVIRINLNFLLIHWYLMSATCARCGEQYLPMLESDEIEGLCPACLFDPERTQSYCHWRFLEQPLRTRQVSRSDRLSDSDLNSANNILRTFSHSPHVAPHKDDRGYFYTIVLRKLANSRRTVCSKRHRNDCPHFMLCDINQVVQRASRILNNKDAHSWYRDLTKVQSRNPWSRRITEFGA